MSCSIGVVALNPKISFTVRNLPETAGGRLQQIPGDAESLFHLPKKSYIARIMSMRIVRED